MEAEKAEQPGSLQWGAQLGVTWQTSDYTGGPGQVPGA